jgi:hypothetical protein
MHLRSSIAVAGAAFVIFAPVAGAHVPRVTATEPDACNIWNTDCLQSHPPQDFADVNKRVQSKTRHAESPIAPGSFRF